METIMITDALQHEKDSTQWLEADSIKLPIERRRHRRTELEICRYAIERYDGLNRGSFLGEIINISPSGIKIRTRAGDVRLGAQLRIRLRLPTYAGIFPFVAADGSSRGCEEWTGWMTVTRVRSLEEGDFEVAGKLVDMRDIDRGMLQLYLSAQPLAA